MLYPYTTAQKMQCEPRGMTCTLAMYLHALNPIVHMPYYRKNTSRNLERFAVQEMGERGPDITEMRKHPGPCVRNIAYH